jgi:hypothetical protein
MRMHRNFLAVNNSELGLKTMKHGGFGCEHQNGLGRDFLAVSALRLKKLQRMPENLGDVEGGRSFLRFAPAVVPWQRPCRRPAARPLSTARAPIRRFFGPVLRP